MSSGAARRLATVVLVALLWLVGANPLQPAIAQTTSAREPVAVDRRTIFEVSDSGGFSARERAERANDILRSRLRELESSPKVTVRERETADGQAVVPVLYVDERYLISVTSADTPPGLLPSEQADIWQQSLAEALDRAHAQRTSGHFQRWLVVVVVLLGGGALDQLGAAAPVAVLGVPLGEAESAGP